MIFAVSSQRSHCVTALSRLQLHSMAEYLNNNVTVLASL